MSELLAVIQKAAADMVANGSLNELVKKGVEQAVADAIGEQFRRYSGFSKQIEAAVKEAMSIDPTQMRLPAYNQFILEIIRAKLRNHIETKVASEIETSLDNLLSGEVKKEMPLAELIASFKEWARENDGYRERACTVHIERSEYGSIWIYFDGKPHVDKYRCAYRLLLSKDGEVNGARFQDIDIGKKLFLGDLYGFERTVFHLYSAKTVITHLDQWDEMMAEYEDVEEDV
jgi:hypothetical protein